MRCVLVARAPLRGALAFLRLHLASAEALGVPWVYLDCIGCAGRPWVVSCVPWDSIGVHWAAWLSLV